MSVQVSVPGSIVSGPADVGALGVDIVLDQNLGPLLLEANARPGLAIQIANGQGLLPRIQAIQQRCSAGGTEGDP